MFLKKEDFKKLNSNEKVRIEIVETPEEVKLWSRLDSEIENMKYQDVYDFMSVSSKNHGAKCIIAYLDEIAVGVAHYFVDTHKLGLISSVGVLENYRKQNIGSSIMNKSIENLFNISKGEIAALYSFVGAQDFYKKLGFVKKQIWNFYILKSIGG
jgi:N-acetylglutamate synthase-like GNAT family acetyltransferase